jgi:hypothetical protein
MQTLENDSTTVACVVADSETPNGQLRGRPFQRHEARHSFPARGTGPRRCRRIRADLLAALLDEHQPAGMTERHLIEELATIIWRKRRVLLAEGAKINEGLKSA